MKPILKIICLIWALVAGSSSAILGDDTPEAFVDKFLTTHWAKGVDNKNAAEAEFKRAQDIYRDHESILLAYAINRMQHRNNDDALAIARKLNQRHEENLDGWMLRIWLEALTDNYDQSLVAITQLKQQIKKSGNDPAIIKKTSSRLARLIGYMQGPVNHKINRDILESALRSVVDGMTPDQLDSFNNEREEVLTQFDTLTKTFTKKISDERVEIEKANQAETMNLNRRNVDLEQRSSQLMPQMQQIRAEGDRQISAIRAQTSPLESQIASINSDISRVQLELGFLFDELFRLESQFPNHPDIPFILARIRNAEITLSNLRQQGRNASAQISQLHGRIRQVSSEFDARVARVKNEINSIDRERRKNNRRLDKLARGPEVASGKIGALDDRVEALTTYDPFPLELFRIELIEKLTK